MAANQASELYDKAKIFVIPTKNFGQAYSILSMLDYEIGDAEEIAEGMKNDMQGVVTGMITTSIRTANIDGVDIKEGDYIGFVDKQMLCSTTSKVETFKTLCEKLVLEEKSFLVTSYGLDVSAEEKQAVKEFVEENYKGVEFYELDGGQEVYDFIMILE